MRWALILCVACGSQSAQQSSSAEDEETESQAGLATLGEFPLCEPSAALRAPWDQSLWVVADNEVHEQLFLFRESGSRLEPAGTIAMPAQNRPRDIEALANVDGELLVVGSHSARRDGSRSAKRHRMRWLRHRDGSLEEVTASDASNARLAPEETCIAHLFGDPPPEGAERVCAVLAESPRALNIEGAVTVNGRTWIGLRAPLVDERAVMLRLGARGLNADQVVLLDLDGRGIRELALEGSNVVGIAGPTDDAAPGFFRFELRLGSALEQSVTRKGPLPAFSEGLWSRGVVIDGDQGGRRCDEPARQAPF